MTDDFGPYLTQKVLRLLEDEPIDRCLSVLGSAAAAILAGVDNHEQVLASWHAHVQAATTEERRLMAQQVRSEAGHA